MNLTIQGYSQSKTYSLLEDANGDITLSTYNTLTNSSTNSFDLNSTSLSSGFYSELSIYDEQNKKIIIFNENGIINHIDVLTGTVNDFTPPFAFSGGFNWCLELRQTQVYLIMHKLKKVSFSSDFIFCFLKRNSFTTNIK